MYRTQLQAKMAAENTETLNSQFINKVVQLPAVVSALGYATSYYEKAKGSNALVNRALETSENFAKAAVTQVQPFASKFKPQIELLDSYAIFGLDTIETKLPVITKSPEEIYNTTKDYVTDKLEPAKQMGTNTVENLRTKAYQVGHVGYTTAATMLDTKVGKIALNSVDSVLSVAEHYVDYYLPTSEEKKGDRSPSPTNVEEKMAYSVRKALRISSKTYTGAMEKLYQAQETTKALTLQLNLMQIAHNLNPTVLSEQANTFLTSLLTEPQDQSAPESPALQVTRQLARRLVGVYSSAYSALQGVPTHARQRLDEALVHANDIYTSVLKATNTEEIANSLASQLKEKLGNLQKLLGDIQTSTTSWLGAAAQQASKVTKVEVNGHTSNDSSMEEMNRVD